MRLSSLFPKNGLHYPPIEQSTRPLLTSGAPQGSVLRQALFRVFIADQEVEIECTLSHFANSTRVGGLIC